MGGEVVYLQHLVFQAQILTLQTATYFPAQLQLWGSSFQGLLFMVVLVMKDPLIVNIE